MLTAHAHIVTETPGRYLAQLCKHANSMHQKNPFMHKDTDQSDGAEHARVEHVEQTDTDATLTLSIGRCVLRADAEALTVRAEAANEQNLRQIQQIITRDLERFGRRQRLTVTWQQSEAG